MNVQVSASLLFALSTIVALWIAPDKRAALVAAALLLGGLMGAWLLAWAGRARPTRVALLGCLGLAVTAGAAMLALYAEVSGSLAAEAKFNAINANVLAGALVISLAMGAMGAVWLWAQVICMRRWWTVAALMSWGILWLGSALVLIATGSRGAWGALLVAALAAAGWMLRPWAAHRTRAAAVVVDAAFVVAAATGVALWLGWLQMAPSALPAGDRVALWRDGLALASDAPFTGSGLRSTMMALSTYVYILHVGYISHVHNLYLELVVEQGLVGLIAWLCLICSALSALVQARSRRVTPIGMQAALLAALVALLVHGLVDAGLYASRLAFLLFLPIGAAWAAGGRAHSVDLEARSRRLLGALAPLAAVALLFAWPGSRAAWQANLGVTAQTQAELFLYTWPEWPMQDALRRSPAVDLTPAMGRYQAALTLDPSNATANRRLGQIALSQGDYIHARQLLEAAFARQPDHYATRLLLGEVYALAGESARAADLWQTVDVHLGQLTGRHWWVNHHVSAAQRINFDVALAEFAALSGERSSE
jgi:O-antigen ligase